MAATTTPPPTNSEGGEPAETELTTFPSQAVRLLLTEYARIDQAPGYQRVVSTEFDAHGDLWTVSRLDEVLDADWKVTRPALVRLTVERRYNTKVSAMTQLGKVKCDLADAIVCARAARGAERSGDALIQARQTAELGKWESKVSELTARAAALEEAVASGFEEHYYFPIDATALEFELATLRL